MLLKPSWPEGLEDSRGGKKSEEDVNQKRSLVHGGYGQSAQEDPRIIGGNRVGGAQGA